MAIAFARIDVHTRSKAHSAINGAAYRAGSRLFDERTGETFDYSNRKDVKYHGIMLPEGAHQKFLDQEILWNAAEHAERRKDAQIAKDLKLALPRDVSDDHHIELARAFAYEHFVANGIAADISIHDDKDGNPHAHIYLTMRRIIGDSFDRLKARDLNPQFTNGKNGKGFIKENDYWGEQWRHYQNGYFRKHDIDLEVDPNHVIPQRHEGRIKNKEAHYLKEENRLKKEATIEIALTDPANILNSFSTTHSTFSDRDIQNFVFKLVDRDDDDGGSGESGGQSTLFENIIAKLKAHQDFVHLGPGEDGRERYTTRANYRRETKLIDDTKALMLLRGYAVKRSDVKRIAQKNGLNVEQSSALQFITRDAGISALVGRAGTGKSSYVLKAAYGVWNESGYNVRGMAVSGIATKGLEEVSGIPSSLVYSVKQQILKGQFHIDKNDIFVMDEAGMTDLHDMSVIVEHIKEKGAKLVLVGDHAQLQPVGPGAPFRAIIEQIGFAELNDIRRQKDKGDRQASVLLSRAETTKAINYYHGKGRIHIKETPSDSQTALIKDWGSNLTQENLGGRLILAHRNDDVGALNLKARDLLILQGVIQANAQSVATKKGRISLAPGDRILFLRNNTKLGVHNGDFATVVNINGNSITAKLSSDATTTFSTSDYGHFTYGYAATVHKSQGGTFDHVYVYAGGKAWDRYLTYVAFTRHRDHLAIYADKETHTDLNVLKKHLGRENFRDSVLDWPLSYSIRRGFDPESMAGRFVDKVAGANQIIKDKWLFVVNYEAYRLNKEHKTKLKHALHRREEAKKVASFVDLHRELGKKWSDIHNSLTDDANMSDHPDYLPTYEQTLIKNKLASEIYQHTDRYKLALEHNGMTIETLTTMAIAHQRHERAKDYLTEYQQGRAVHRQKLAAEIYPVIKEYYGGLIYSAKLQGLDHRSVIAQCRVDYQAYESRKILSQLTGQARQNFLLVQQYEKIDRELKRTWKNIYAQDAINRLAIEQTEQYHYKSVERDRLGNVIAQQPDQYKEALDLYEITEKKITASQKRYLARERVKAFYTASEVGLDNLASQIKQDIKAHYSFLNEFYIDYKSIHFGNWRYQKRAMISRLPKSDRECVRLLEKYRDYNRLIAQAWTRTYAQNQRTGQVENKEYKIKLAQQYSVKRDQIAAQIHSHLPDFKKAFEIVKVDLSKIEKQATQHRHYDFIMRYQRESRPTHRAHMASYIFLNMKAYRTALSVLDIDKNQLFQDERRLLYLLTMKELPREQKQAYRLLEQYSLKNMEAGKAWASLRQAEKLGESDKQLLLLVKSAQHLSVQRNQLASQLISNLYINKDSEFLHAFHVDYSKLAKFSADFHLWNKVNLYVHAHRVADRDKLAHAILQDKKTYRYVHQFKLDWKQLSARSKIHVRRRNLAQLSKEERHHWRLVDRYDQARVDAAKAWSLYFKNQNSGASIPGVQKSFCYQLTSIRNKLAYEIALSPEKFAPYLMETRIKFNDIEKHAVTYGRSLQNKQKPYPKRPAKAPRALPSNTRQEKHYFKYQVVNDALIAMGAEFYDTVIGEQGKRSGQSMRYGRRNSLSASIGGSNVGGWYSFETGAKGGPIQLLMDAEHGWGLSYEEAIKEGARLANLQSYDATPIQHKKPQKSKEQIDHETKQTLDKKAKKIASARHYYLSAQPIDNTLGERYLRDTRGIEGDLSEFRFHPRIRDDRYIKNKHGEDKQVTSYHPGIVVASRNRGGEIVASQTIILDPNTANKVDKDTVGAVKRSRGEVKGSAGLIHIGTSNKVIIAEGPETAASLIAAAPEAHIYVTLGNTKNAEQLGWLATKHQTKQLYFAADKDTNTNNITALKAVAKTLKYEYGIDVYTALPYLEQDEKYDFNDILKEKGVDVVKEQLAKAKKIRVPEQKEIVDEQTIHNRLHDALAEKLEKRDAKRACNVKRKPVDIIKDDGIQWDAIKSIDNSDIKWISQYRELALKKTDEKDISEIHSKIHKFMGNLSGNRKAMAELQKQAPQLAAHIKQHFKGIEQTRPKSIDWLAPEYKIEWEGLREVNDGSVQWMVKFYDLAGKKDEKDIPSIRQSIDRLCMKVCENKSVFKQVKRVAPKLAQKMGGFARSRDKSRGIDQDS